MGCAGSKGTQVVSSNPTNGKAAPKSVKAPVTTTTVKEGDFESMITFISKMTLILYFR